MTDPTTPLVYRHFLGHRRTSTQAPPSNNVDEQGGSGRGRHRRRARGAPPGPGVLPVLLARPTLGA